MKHNNPFMIISMIILIMAFLGIGPVGAAGTLPAYSGEIVRPGIGAKIDAYLTRIVPFGFSGAALVAKGDEILINKGFGSAIRSQAIPNTAGTVFCVGSITKQFTAAAIMVLEMRGRLKTEDPLSKHLEGVPADKSGITLQHLLTHTSGLVPDVGGDYETSGRDETVKKILALPLAFKPGERFAYSNVNFTLLAAIIEKDSGKAYEDFLYDSLFKPAGMEWTGYRKPKWEQSVVAHWYAGGRDNLNSLTRPFPYWNLIGNGGILSTTGDMFKWHRALLGDKILSAEAKKKMFTPYLNDYGYGWDVLEGPRGQLIQHNGGSGLGNNAEIRRYMGAGIVTILLCNQFYSGRPLIDSVRDKIEALAFGGEVNLPPAVLKTDEAALKKYEGVYIFPSGAEFSAALDNNGLVVRARGQDAVNALVFPDPAVWGMVNDITLKSAAVLDAALKGDWNPLGDILANREKRFDLVRDFIGRRIREDAGRVGNLSKAESLYTRPSAAEEGAMETVVALRGEKGNSFLRLVWREGKNVGVGPVEIIAPVWLIFQPLSDVEFAGYDLASSKTVRIKFESDGGVPSRLVTMGLEPIRAERKKN